MTKREIALLAIYGTLVGGLLGFLIDIQVPADSEHECVSDPAVACPIHVEPILRMALCTAFAAVLCGRRLLPQRRLTWGGEAAYGLGAGAFTGILAVLAHSLWTSFTYVAGILNSGESGGLSITDALALIPLAAIFYPFAAILGAPAGLVYVLLIRPLLYLPRKPASPLARRAFLLI